MHGAIATVTSLEGQEIEPYANELFRNRKLGEKTKNNGLLLLVTSGPHLCVGGARDTCDRSGDGPLQPWAIATP
jgi:hypothetical protein